MLDPTGMSDPTGVLGPNVHMNPPRRIEFESHRDSISVGWIFPRVGRTFDVKCLIITTRNAQMIMFEIDMNNVRSLRAMNFYVFIERVHVARCVTNVHRATDVESLTGFNAMNPAY